MLLVSHTQQHSRRCLPAYAHPHGCMHAGACMCVPVRVLPPSTPPHTKQSSSSVGSQHGGSSHPFSGAMLSHCRGLHVHTTTLPAASTPSSVACVHACQCTAPPQPLTNLNPTSHPPPPFYPTPPPPPPRTCPVAVWAVCIGEDVIRFDRPCCATVRRLGIHICSRGGVQHIHTPIKVHVVDQPTTQQHMGNQ